MKSVALKAYPRTSTGTIAVRKIRSQGRIPAVMYGPKSDPRSLEVEHKSFESLIQHSVGEHLLVDLSIEDEQASRLTLLQEIQHHPLNGRVLHIDFHEVNPDEHVEIEVPVETTGEAVGVKLGGGTMEHVLFNVRVRALPKDLPEYIVVDVSHLDTGKTLHIGDIQAPEGVQILGDKDIPVVSVSESRLASTDSVETEVAEAVASEPEVIKEKKEKE